MKGKKVMSRTDIGKATGGSTTLSGITLSGLQTTSVGSIQTSSTHQWSKSQIQLTYWHNHWGRSRYCKDFVEPSFGDAQAHTVAKNLPYDVISIVHHWIKDVLVKIIEELIINIRKEDFRRRR